MDMSMSKLQEIVEDRGAWHAAVHEVTKSRKWLSDWTKLKWAVGSYALEEVSKGGAKGTILTGLPWASLAGIKLII